MREIYGKEWRWLKRWWSLLSRWQRLRVVWFFVSFSLTACIADFDNWISFAVVVVNLIASIAWLYRLPALDDLEDLEDD